MIPGIDIKDIAVFKQKINKNLNPSKKPYIELLKVWNLVNKKVYDIINELNYEIFYILYEHPVHEFKDKLSKVNKKELLDFIDNNFFSAENSGTDVTITSEDFSVIFVCNHDDEIYLAKS